MSSGQRKFRMYVDEVGNADLGSSENPNHRFLSLTGAIADLDYVRETLHPEMEATKQRFFGSRAVPFSQRPSLLVTGTVKA